MTKRLKQCQEFTFVRPLRALLASITICVVLADGSSPTIFQGALSGIDVVDRAFLGIEEGYEKGYELSGFGSLNVVWLNKDEFAEDSYALHAGKSYRFIAVSDQPDGDLDLELRDKSGRPLLRDDNQPARDLTSNPTASIDFTARSRGSAIAHVKMHAAPKGGVANVALLCIVKTSGVTRSPHEAREVFGPVRRRIVETINAAAALRGGNEKTAPISIPGKPKPWWLYIVRLDASGSEPDAAANVFWEPQHYGGASKLLYAGELGSLARIGLTDVKGEPLGSYQSAARTGTILISKDLAEKGPIGFRMSSASANPLYYAIYTCRVPTSTH